MSTERHNAQNSAIAVVGDNESPAVSVSNSTASSRHSESPEGGLNRHAQTFINPDDYRHTSDSDGEDAGATGAETSLTIYPTHAEAGTAELNTAPANTIATNDRDIIDTTMSTERHAAQNSVIAVVGDNEAPAVSVSNSASSTAYSSSFTEL